MTRVVVFARAPEPGACKTRLIPVLGAHGAARLHGALARYAVGVAVAAAVGPVELWCAPDPDHPFFAACARELGVELMAQPPGDLGAKMLAAFRASQGPLLLMGSDCPAITPDDLRACARALETADAVFLPAEDGGYGLVGARRPLPTIFHDVAWGTDSVMAQTRAALQGQAIAWREPRVIWDVDWPADLARLRLEHPDVIPQGLQLPKDALGD